MVPDGVAGLLTQSFDAVGERCRPLRDVCVVGHLSSRRVEECARSPFAYECVDREGPDGLGILVTNPRGPTLHPVRQLGVQAVEQRGVGVVETGRATRRYAGGDLKEL